MSDTDPYTDVVELCALLQCLGFSVKSLDTNDTNITQDGGARTVVINCQSSGLHVVLESTGLACSCPQNQQNSGVWHVSGMVGGKQLDKVQEFGYSILGSLPKSHRDRLSGELHEMIRCIKQNNESEPQDKDIASNRSSSMVDLKTPEKVKHKIKADTPTRYRSLDTLTKVVKKENNVDLPAPKPLQRVQLNSERNTDEDVKKHSMCLRQGTYTVASTASDSRVRSKTSSPIHASQNKMFMDLLAAEKAATELSIQLGKIVRGFEEDKKDSSASWLALDVSKISVLKGAEPQQTQFASSPNIPSLLITREDSSKNKMKCYESASTSNLLSDKPGSDKTKKISYLRRISPNFLKFKNSGQAAKEPRSISEQNKSSKTTGLIKPKATIQIPQSSQSYSKSSPNLSTASRKKFSHVKSTIPKPMKKE